MRTLGPPTLPQKSSRKNRGYMYVMIGEPDSRHTANFKKSQIVRVYLCSDWVYYIIIIENKFENNVQVPKALISPNFSKISYSKVILDKIQSLTMEVHPILQKNHDSNQFWGFPPQKLRFWPANFEGCPWLGRPQKSKTQISRAQKSRLRCI